MNYVSYDIISQIYRLLKTEIVLWLKISLVVDFMQRSPVFKKNKTSIRGRFPQKLSTLICKSMTCCYCKDLNRRRRVRLELIMFLLL